MQLTMNGTTNMIYMNGTSPSGFTNSKYTGMMTCTQYNNLVNPSSNNPTTRNVQSIKVGSLIDVFTNSTSIGDFFALLWYNPWVLFVWFKLW